MGQILTHKLKMVDEIYKYDVKCSTCRSTFKVELFESHQKNLFVADKKDWYCDTCKKDYFDKQTKDLTEAQKNLGFSELNGTAKQISWGVKVRGDLVKKVDYLKQSLKFDTEDEKAESGKVFDMFMNEWNKQTEAKWWIDNRRMNIRDISKRIAELSDSIK